MVLHSICKSRVINSKLTNLEDFHNLYQIFSNVCKKRNLSERNPILLNSQTKKESSVLYLKKIEYALNLLDIDNWPKKEKRALISRLTSNNSSESFSLLNELEVYLSLVDYIGPKNVKYQYPASGKIPDLKVDINDKQIILELKSFHDRDSIIHIKNIFRTLCEFLLLVIEGKNYYVRINIDTNRLLNKKIEIKGQNVLVIDEEKSIQLLESSLSELHLE